MEGLLYLGVALFDGFNRRGFKKRGCYIGEGVYVKGERSCLRYEFFNNFLEFGHFGAQGDQSWEIRGLPNIDHLYRFLMWLHPNFLFLALPKLKRTKWGKISK